MNSGGFLESGGGAKIVADMPYNSDHHSHGQNNLVNGSMPTSAAISQPLLVTKSMFSSPSLSLTLQTNMEGKGEVGGRMSENNNNESSPGNMGRVRAQEKELEITISVTDNMDGDDQDAAEDKPPRKERYHRHIPQQIQELESLFIECPYPDENQRLELSRRLSLENSQVKFWFQNRRTQMKKHENWILQQENDKLRAENISFQEAMRNPMCTICGCPMMLGDIFLEEKHLQVENIRLKDELDRLCARAGNFLSHSVSSTTNTSAMSRSTLELSMGANMNVNGFGSSSIPLDYEGWQF